VCVHVCASVHAPGQPVERDSRLTDEHETNSRCAEMLVRRAEDRSDVITQKRGDDDVIDHVIFLSPPPRPPLPPNPTSYSSEVNDDGGGGGGGGGEDSDDL